MNASQSKLQAVNLVTVNLCFNYQNKPAEPGPAQCKIGNSWESFYILLSNIFNSVLNKLSLIIICSTYFKDSLRLNLNLAHLHAYKHEKTALTLAL